MADWYFGSYPRCGFEKYLVKPCNETATNRYHRKGSVVGI